MDNRTLKDPCVCVDVEGIARLGVVAAASVQPSVAPCVGTIQWNRGTRSDFRLFGALVCRPAVRRLFFFSLFPLGLLSCVGFFLFFPPFWTVVPCILPCSSGLFFFVSQLALIKYITNSTGLNFGGSQFLGVSVIAHPAPFTF